MLKPSNINTISQNKMTNSDISPVENLLNKEVEDSSGSQTIKEPSLVPLSDSKYGDVIVEQRKDAEGMIEIIDNTENLVRHYHIHPSGTYINIDKDGNIIQKTSNDEIKIIMNNKEILIKGDKIEVIKGDKKVGIDGDMNIEVEGKTEITSTGDILLESKGNVEIKAAVDILLNSLDSNLWHPNGLTQCLFAGVPHKLTTTLKGS